jgi:hypothetical protein
MTNAYKCFLRVEQENNPLTSKILGNELIYIKCQMFLQILTRLQSNNITNMSTNIERSVSAKFMAMQYFIGIIENKCILRQKNLNFFICKLDCLQT